MASIQKLLATQLAFTGVSNYSNPAARMYTVEDVQSGSENAAIKSRAQVHGTAVGDKLG